MRQAISTLSEERPEVPGPNIQPSRLAVPWPKQADEHAPRSCKACDHLLRCVQQVRRLQPFALAVCEAPLFDEQQRKTRPAVPVRERVLEYVNDNPGARASDIARAVQTTTEQTTRACNDLATAGRIIASTDRRNWPLSYAGQVQPKPTPQPTPDEMAAMRRMYAQGATIHELRRLFHRGHTCIEGVVRGTTHKGVTP